MIISTTSPTPEGEMLWMVNCTGSYYDNDPRGSGDCKIGQKTYVLAKSMAEAIKKAEPTFARVRKDSTAQVKVEATIVTIEALIPAVELTGSGLFYGGSLRKVELLPEDAKRYRIGVCLIPLEEDEK